jgi:signal transduction histidine kinase
MEGAGVRDSEKWAASDATDEEPAPGSERSWFRRLAGILPRQDTRRTINAEIIAALNDVAGAVAGAHGAHDVLVTIADRAKQITQAEKAAVVLTNETADALGVDTVVVRGEMARHLQDWWLARLDELRAETFASGETVMERHEKDRAWLACAPLRVRDHPVGMLAVVNSADRPFTDRQVAMLAVLAAFAASSIESARLAEQSHYVLLASERNRIAREMHDGVVQSLFSISLGLEVCKKLVVRDPQEVAARLENLQENLNASMTDLRRLIYDLRPAQLSQMGLAGAIEYWIREITAGESVHGSLAVEGELPDLLPQTEACLYRVAKEAVSNVIKHAYARHFEVRMVGGRDAVSLTVEDDGCGFDAGEVVVGHKTNGLGLRSIRERVDKENGYLTIESEPGRGTRINVEFTDLGSA